MQKEFEKEYQTYDIQTMVAVRQAIMNIELIFDGSAVHHGIKVVKLVKRNAYKVYFSTGGWSGNEAVINAMMKWPFINLFHTKWTRGGHYEFIVSLD
jgi:hypothetical protein